MTSAKIMGIIMAVIAVAQSFNVERLHRNIKTERAEKEQLFKIAYEFRDVAKEWQESYEALKRISNDRIATMQDDVLVCNSMLPEGRKFH